MNETIRKRFDEEAGSWMVDVLLYVAAVKDSQWFEVAQHCEEEEADDCIRTLGHWRKQSCP